MTVEKAIEILSDVGDINRCCAEDAEALDMAIKALEQQPCDDCISRKSIKQKLQENYDFFVNAYDGFGNLPQSDKSRVDEILNCIAMVVNEPPATPKAEQKWIPVKSHKITDEEREKEDYPEEWHSILVCEMPEEGQEILVTIKGHKENYVEKDTAYNDCDGWYLDSGYDWEEDAIAWMPLPEPYKAESEGEE